MDYLQAILLGAVQALTEFLPISSSAHLILFRDWLGFETVDGLTFDVALHMGTVIALIGYFRRDLAGMVRGFFAGIQGRDTTGTAERRLLWFIMAATVPAGIAGVFLDGFIDAVRNPTTIVITLVLGGILFLVVEKTSKLVLSLKDLRFWGSIAIGVAQSVALIPGVSRSGITIATGMSLGLRRTEAARFSFLLSVPIMIAAGAKKALDIPAASIGPEQVGVLAMGILTSAVLGWVVIRFLLRFLERHTLAAFAYYRFALAAVVLVWVLR